MSEIAEVATTSGGNPPRKSRRGRQILGVVLVVLILLLGLASFLLYRLIVPTGGSVVEQADETGLIWVRSIYGMTEAAKDQLERTQSADTAPDGTIWVVDGAHRLLMQFSADGRFLRSTKGPANAPITQPGRFVIDPSGTFYVTDNVDSAIRVINEAGNDVGSFGVPSPLSVAVSADRVVVGSVAGFAITDKQGKPISIIGSRGKGDDQFDYVHGVAIGTDGTIYVVDSYNNRLSAYEPDGTRKWLVRTGSPANSAGLGGGRLDSLEVTDSVASGDNALQLPLGMTIDGAGRLVVIDMFDSTIAVFDPKDGSFIGKYGVIGPDDGEFFYPQDISYDAQRDWFTVADSLNNRVQVVRIPGSSTDGGTLAAARRGITGPLRACLFPLLLLLLVIVIAVVRAVLRRRSTRKRGLSALSGTAGEGPADDADSLVEQSTPST